MLKLFILGFFMLVLFGSAYCQNAKSREITTIIIVRHAEKQTGNDPALTPAGMLRAEKLSSLFQGVKPDAIYTSPYIRTRQTATPWAKEIRLELTEYNPQKLDELADYLKTQKGKTFLIVGHSNTNPGLVNLLINEDKYKNLDDTDYETIFVVRVKKGVATASILKR